MTQLAPHLVWRLAASGDEVEAAQALRHRVFVEELGARGGGLSDPGRGIEADRFDRHCRHLLLLDALRGHAVVGTARVLTPDGAEAAGGYATEEEFDIGPLRRSGRRLLEIGRTCLRADIRGGAAMHHLWQGLAALAEEEGAEVLFGLASFPGTDLGAVAQPLACLQRDHLAPEALRPRSLRPIGAEPGPIDRRTAVLAMPALVKAYLRMGAVVGEGACVDEAFRCIDVCMVLDTAPAGARSFGPRR